MWHEARKQERKIRGMLVDYRKRAERRRDFYEKIKADPTQFLQIHGRQCKIHLDPAIAAAAEGPATMMPWQGQSDNLIDRFDVRAHLDFIPNVSTNEDDEATYEERQVNYERYRIIAQNAFLVINEEKFLKQLHLEEQFGYTENEPKKKKPTGGAAIGFNYEDGTGTSTFVPPANEEEGSEENSDSDLDVDLSINISKIDQAQAHEMNRHGRSFGMSSNDFYSFLTNDLEEAESFKQAKEEEHEKALFSGRKSRRERRAHREKRLANRKISPPSYAARESPTIKIDLHEKSESRSPSPENSGKITFITSFGDEEEPQMPVKPTYADKVKFGSKLKKLRHDSEERMVFRATKVYKRSSSKEKITFKRKSRVSTRERRRSDSRSRKLRNRRSYTSSSRSRSRSRSRSKRRRSHSRSHRRRSSSSGSSSSGGRRRSKRSSSSARWPKRRRARSRSKSCSSSDSKSRSRSKSKSRPRTSRSVSKTKSKSRSRSSTSSSRSAEQIARGGSPMKEKQKSKSPSELNTNRHLAQCSTMECKAPSPPVIRNLSPHKVDDGLRKEEAKAFPRYYGRKKSDQSSSSELGDSSDADSKESPPLNTQINNSNLKIGNSGTTTKIASKPSMSLAERLKRKRQALLNKQFKADKIAEQMKTEREKQEQQTREDELREMALKLRKKQRERRHAYDSDSSSDSSSNSRSKSPPSPKSRKSRSASPKKDREHNRSRERDYKYQRDRDGDYTRRYRGNSRDRDRERDRDKERDRERERDRDRYRRSPRYDDRYERRRDGQRDNPKSSTSAKSLVDY